MFEMLLNKLACAHMSHNVSKKCADLASSATSPRSHPAKASAMKAGARSLPPAASCAGTTISKVKTSGTSSWWPSLRSRSTATMSTARSIDATLPYRSKPAHRWLSGPNKNENPNPKLRNLDQYPAGRADHPRHAHPPQPCRYHN